MILQNPKNNSEDEKKSKQNKKHTDNKTNKANKKQWCTMASCDEENVNILSIPFNGFGLRTDKTKDEDATERG